MTLGTYILEETKSGTHEERRQYLEGTNGRSMGGYVMDHNTTREQETIRHNKSKSYGTKYLETGSRDSMRNAVLWFWECWNHPEMRGNARKCAKSCKGLGIELLTSGSNISAWIISAKLEWVLQNITLDLEQRKHLGIQEVESQPIIQAWERRQAYPLGKAMPSRQKPIKRSHPSLKITDGIPSLLCQDAGQETTVCPGLPKA